MLSGRGPCRSVASPNTARTLRLSEAGTVTGVAGACALRLPTRYEAIVVAKAESTLAALPWNATWFGLVRVTFRPFARSHDETLLTASAAGPKRCIICDAVR